MKIKKVSPTRMMFTGMLLGLGAPAGYFIYSYFLIDPQHLSFLALCIDILQNQTKLVLYLTVPTMAVFALFGLFHGRLEAKLSSQTEQMDHFLHVAAHDIRTPLTLIRGGVHQILHGHKDNLSSENQEYVELVYRQTEVMRELIDELLDIYRIESGTIQLEKKPVDIKETVNKSIQEMELLINRKKVKIKTVFNLPDTFLVEADSFRLRQLFRNLLGNALKFSPEQGEIEIKVEPSGSSRLELQITNHGPNIPEEKLPYIFNRFFQAKAAHQELGTGLGLSICRDIAELHKGKIWAENCHQPQGVAFHLVLPRK